MKTATQDEINNLGEMFGVEQTAALLAYSQSWERGKRPSEVFFDLTDLFGDEYLFERLVSTGEYKFYKGKYAELGLIELSYIGEALTEYAEKSAEVRAFFKALDELEREGE
jgi:hypothetical protein